MNDRLTTYSALLGQTIGQIRVSQSMEQSQMANALGISQASYSRMEGGKSLWTVDQLMVACRTLNFDPAQAIQYLKVGAQMLAKSENIEVIAASRANSQGGREAAERDDSGGALLVGAALGALLATLALKK